MTLYLRADGPLGPTGRTALDAALAALARLPGARLVFYLEPRDRSASALAEQLVSLPSDGARARILAALRARDAQRWADPWLLDQLVRQLGMQTPQRTRRGRALSPPAASARESSSSVAQTLLRRPFDVEYPQPAFAAIGTRHFTAAEVDTLAHGEYLPSSMPSSIIETSRPSLRGPSGFSGRVIRIALGTSIETCPNLTAALPLAEAGRARLLVIDGLGETNKPVPSALRQALRYLGPDAAVRLTAHLCERSRTELPTELAEVAWLLQAAGVDPLGVPSLPSPPLPSDAAHPEPPRMTIDDGPANRSDLSSLWRPRSLRLRLAGSR